jgi:hypothetical protein
MTTSARTWLTELARTLQTSPPTDAEIDDLLSLASVAAHASERAAAPVACWMAARAGRPPAEALALARELVERADRPAPPGTGQGEAALP